MLPMVLLLSLAASAGSPLDLIVEHGRIVDGTGAPWFRADLGIRGDRIVRIGPLGAVPAKVRIDAKDHLVAPGFIDLLGQSELNLLVDPRAESKVRQGVTTELTGEGVSVAPQNAASLAELKDFLETFKLRIDWTDLDGYWRRLAAARPAMNLATMVGAAQVRIVVLGKDDVHPSAEQLARMQNEVERAMRQGAFGVSSALIYPPGSYARTDELVALARTVARFGGFYATHIRSEDDDESAAIDEAFAIGKRAGVSVEIWHLKVAGKRNWGRMAEVLARLEQARANGQDVSANVYPYVAGANGLSADFPGWAQAGGVEALLARLRDPPQRKRIEQEVVAGWKDADLPERILIAETLMPEAKPYRGKRLSEVASAMGRTPASALVELTLLDRGNTGVLRFIASEPDLELAMKQPWVAFGIDAPADAVDGPLGPHGTHPRAFGSAPRVLGQDVRDRKLFTVEEAVRKWTSLPARRMGLWDRGLLRPGMIADVVVFDPDTIADLATYEQPKRYPTGVETVLVNGIPVLRDGVRTAARPGRGLRHPLPAGMR